MKNELIPKKWLHQKFLEERLKEPEVVQIDDYFSELVTDLTIGQEAESFVEERVELENSGNLVRCAYLKVPASREEGSRLDERATVSETLNRLACQPRLCRRQQVELFIEDQVFRGTVEKVEGEYVYLRENFGMTWRRFPMDQIYRVKLIQSRMRW